MPKSKGNSDTKDDLQKLRNGIGSMGKDAKMLSIEQEKFKMGTQDNSIRNLDQIIKLESTSEGILKKIEKAYTDIDPKNKVKNLKVESRSSGGQVEIGKYLENFVWDDTKYPRNQSLDELCKIFTTKLTTVDNNLRHKIMAFNESKQAAANSFKKETTTLAARDLNDLFASKKGVNQSMFLKDSLYMTTLIAVVEKNKVNDWNNHYEKLDDMIVPRSSQELLSEEDFGNYKLFRFFAFRRVVDDIRQKAKDQLKVIVREYEYNVETIMERESNSKKVLTQTDSDKKTLASTCIESFKEMYAIYAHVKVLKCCVDCHSRFSSPSDYIVSISYIYKGKEKKVTNALIALYAEGKASMYGTKEELQDTDDFFPYAFANVDFGVD